MSKNRVLSVYNSPKSSDALWTIIKYFVNTPINRQPLKTTLQITPSGVRHRGRSFFTLSDVIESDPYGWLLIDYTMLSELARDTAASIPALHTAYMTLRLYDLSQAETAQLLRMGLEGFLPPGTAWGYSEVSKDTWWDVRASLGLSDHHDHLLRIYRCPYVMLPKTFSKRKSDQLKHFMHLCWQYNQLNAPPVLPEPFSYVLQACGSAWNGRLQSDPTTPVDDHGISWTATHMLVWQGGQSDKWGRYRYTFDKPVEHNMHNWFDWVAEDEHSEAFGVGQMPFRKLGFRLAQVDAAVEILEHALNVGPSVAVNYVEDVNALVKIKEEAETKERKKALINDNTQQLVLDAGGFCVDHRVGVDTPVDLTLRFLKRGDAWYLGIPDELENAYQVTRALQAVSTAHRARKKETTLSMYNKGDYEGLRFPLRGGKLPSYSTYRSKMGFFVRVDMWHPKWSFYHVLQQMRKYAQHHGTLTMQTERRLIAFNAVLSWLLSGAMPIVPYGEEEQPQYKRRREAMAQQKMMFPLWMCGLEGGINSKHTVKTTDERMKFMSELATRINLPWRGWMDPAKLTGRSPRKTTLEKYLADYMRFVLSMYQAEREILVTAKSARQCLSKLLCPWVPASGFTNTDLRVPRAEWAPSYDNEPPETLKELLHDVYTTMQVYLPPWTEDASEVM